MWPKYDPEKLVNDIITLVVQVNGKVRGELTVPKDIDEKSALELVRGSEQISKWQSGGEIIKVIFVPGRLINIVVKISS
jgi:leucyl-tRNA synthetase